MSWGATCGRRRRGTSQASMEGSRQQFAGPYASPCEFRPRTPCASRRTPWRHVVGYPAAAGIPAGPGHLHRRVRCGRGLGGAGCPGAVCRRSRGRLGVGGRHAGGAADFLTALSHRGPARRTCHGLSLMRTRDARASCRMPALRASDHLRGVPRHLGIRGSRWRRDRLHGVAAGDRPGRRRRGDADACRTLHVCGCAEHALPGPGRICGPSPLPPAVDRARAPGGSLGLACRRRHHRRLRHDSSQRSQRAAGCAAHRHGGGSAAGGGDGRGGTRERCAGTLAPNPAQHAGVGLDPDSGWRNCAAWRGGVFSRVRLRHAAPLWGAAGRRPLCHLLRGGAPADRALPPDHRAGDCARPALRTHGFARPVHDRARDQQRGRHPLDTVRLEHLNETTGRQPFRVPQGHLAGAGGIGSAWAKGDDGGCTAIAGFLRSHQRVDGQRPRGVLPTDVVLGRAGVPDKVILWPKRRGGLRTPARLPQHYSAAAAYYDVTMAVAVDRLQLLRRGRALEIFTVLWNSAEGIVSIVLGLLASSIALIGFGADSFIETSSGAILLWRLQAARDPDTDLAAEATALRLVGVSLVALAAYVIYDSAGALLLRKPPESSVPGIVLAILSLIAMPLLARAKRNVAVALGSRALEADALQTTICTYLSAILLVGLVLNAAWGWWWADPVAALVMAPLIAKEGVEALRGED